MTKTKPARPGHHLLLAVIVVQLVLALVLFDPKLFTGGDNAVYLILAKSLATGQGYRDISQPGAPLHTQYPPGFPALLVPFLFGNNLIAPKILPFLCGLGATALFYFLFYDRRRPMALLLPMVWLATLPILLEYAHWILTEVPFLFFSLLTIFLFQKSTTDRRHPTLFFALALTALVLTSYIRTVGLGLVLAYALWFLLRRRYLAAALVFLVPLLLLVPWFLRGQHSGPEGSYLAQLFARNPYELTAGTIDFRDYAARLVANAELYLLSVLPAVFFLPLRAPAALGLLGVLFSLLVVAGAVVRLRTQGLGAGGLYVLVFAFITLSWPRAWSGDRFLIPVLPFLVLYAWAGMKWLARYLHLRGLEHTLWVLVALNLAAPKYKTIDERVYPLLAAVPRNLSDVGAYLAGNHRAGYRDDWRHYFDAIDWIAAHTPPQAVVVARKPQFVYLSAHRPAFCFPFASDVKVVMNAIDAKQTRYVLLDFFLWSNTSRRVLVPVIRSYPERFRLLYQTPPPEMFVLAVVPPGVD